MMKRCLVLVLGLLFWGMSVGAKELDLGSEGIWTIPDNWGVYSQEKGFWGNRWLEVQRAMPVQESMMSALKNVMGDISPASYSKAELGEYISTVSQSMRTYRFHVEDRQGIHTLDLVVMRLPLAQTIRLSAQVNPAQSAFWKEAFLLQETEAVRQYLAENSKGREALQRELDQTFAKLNKTHTKNKIHANAIEVSPLYRFQQGEDIYYEQSALATAYLNDIAYPSASIVRIGKQGDDLILLGWSMPLSDYDFFRKDIVKINQKGGTGS